MIWTNTFGIIADMANAQSAVDFSIMKYPRSSMRAQVLLCSKYIDAAITICAYTFSIFPAFRSFFNILPKFGDVNIHQKFIALNSRMEKQDAGW
jgi:hypothetical protein